MQRELPPDVSIESGMALAPRVPMVRRPLRFEARLGLASTIVVATVCGGLSWQLARGALADLRSHLVQRGQRVVATLVAEAAEAMQRGDVKALAESAARAHEQGDAIAVRIFDAQGLLVVATGPRANMPGPPPRLDRLPPDPIDVPGVGLDFWYTIPAPQTGASPDGPLGAVDATISTAPLDGLRHRIVVTAIALTLLFMAMGAVAAWAVARAMTRPLAALARAADAIAAGDFSTRVAAERADELGTVASAFNVMVESLARSHRALEDKVGELERANHLKSEFLATVSHELRTPLNVIIGHSEMLADPTLAPSDHAKLVATIRRYAELQLDLVTSVLDFERLAAGGVTCRVESFTIAPLIEDVIALQTVRARPGVQLVTQIAPDCPALETDRIKVHQIVRNLVDNAVKFTESGRVVVEAGPGARAGTVLIAVTDTGPGVPAVELPHIFEPFHQLGASSTRRTNGVGLGLSIVRRLADVLGGEVSASSELGWGSTFRVLLPCELPDHAPRSARDDVAVRRASVRRAA
jgi:signal transduction histidine kinase